MYNGKCTSIEN